MEHKKLQTELNILHSKIMEQNNRIRSIENLLDIQTIEDAGDRARSVKRIYTQTHGDLTVVTEVIGFAKEEYKKDKDKFIHITLGILHMLDHKKDKLRSMTARTTLKDWCKYILKEVSLEV